MYDRDEFTRVVAKGLSITYKIADYVSEVGRRNLIDSVDNFLIQTAKDNSGWCLTPGAAIGTEDGKAWIIGRRDF